MAKVVAFDDTYEHSVANNTNQSRIVLFMDIADNTTGRDALVALIAHVALSVTIL